MFVARQRAGPTTRNPTTPNWARISRRLVKAAISFSPKLGTRFSKVLSWLPGTQRTRVLPCATAVTMTGRPVKKVDVPGELARLMNGDYPLAVRRITDLDLAGFHNHQIDIRLTGPKDGLAIRVIARVASGLTSATSAPVKRGNATSWI